MMQAPSRAVIARRWWPEKVRFGDPTPLSRFNSSAEIVTGNVGGRPPRVGLSADRAATPRIVANLFSVDNPSATRPVEEALRLRRR
ncbi:hypothetical protein [Microbacterium terrisoli]|jgi:hypothetical protein|uniref:hypothetical protein n=1 Tax=Microbacterium terrisoli TaxID=3242192 RepID=UPI0028044EE3|nr:hypothetical protein [Microbacterium protaetiae]